MTNDAFGRGLRLLGALCLLALAACGREASVSPLEAGRADLARGDARAAVVRFKAALQGGDKSVELRYLLGRALLEAGDPSGAAVELDKAMEAQYDPTLVLPRLARATQMAGQSKKVVAQYADKDLADPEAQAALKTAVAGAWLALGDPRKAEDACAAALKAKPDYAPAVVLQARLRAARGESDAALAQLEPLLAASQPSADAWQLKGELAYYVKRDDKAAEEAFRKALQADRTHVPAHNGLVALRLKASDLPGAKKQVEALRSALPGHPQALLSEAQIALVESDFKKARENLQTLLRSAPNHTGVLQLAAVLEARNGSLVIAESHFSKALQVNPKLSFARHSLAKVLLQLGQAGRALETVQPLLAEDPNDAMALATAGEALLRLGRPADAEALLKKASAINPADPKLSSAVAMAQLARGDEGRAFAQLESVAKSSQDTFADLTLVSERLKRREYPAALAAVEGMVRKAPDSASAWDLRGQVLLASRDAAQARQSFEKAVALDPRYFAAIANLAALDWAERKPEQARDRIKAAVAADPTNHHARIALAETSARTGAGFPAVRDILVEAVKVAPSEPAPRLLLIQHALKAKQLKEALAYAQEAAAALPNDLDVLDALGRTQMESGDTQQAISTFRRITGIDTKSARPHMRLADILKATGNRQGAVASLRRALEIEPKLEVAHFSLVQMLVTEGRPREALEVARDMQRRLPNAPGGYLLEAVAQRKLKATEAAIDAGRRGMKQATPADEVALDLFRTLSGTGRVAEADRVAQDWLKDHPRDAAMQYHWAGSYILRGDWATAERLLRRTLEIKPDHPMALNNLAYTLVASDKPGAVPLAQKASELLPNEPAVMDTLALALAADNQAAKALELQRKVVSMAPGELGLRLNLAKIAIKAGDKTLARGELERLATMGSKFQRQSEVASLLKSL